MTAGGRWYPGGRTPEATAPPVNIAGTWGDVTIDGPNVISAEGFEYHVPDLSDVRIVSGPRGLVILHVKVGRMVHVLARGRQLIESDAEARSRSTPTNWSNI